MATGDPMPVPSSSGGLPTLGEVVSGKYRIEKVIAEGGMGVVFEAMHLALDEKVAIKFLRTDATGPDATELAGRFVREARASAKIKSEHVVRVHDVGTSETGSAYIVMERLTGQDLEQIVEKHGFLPIAQAVDYVLQACEALAEAHNIGIVHRDLKPANLFLTHRADGSPCVKVLDFGISKFKDLNPSGSDMNITKTHAVMGSPRYMSPEQMRASKDVDARADVWAIGIILYELFAGTVPFDGQSMPQIFAAILEDAPKNLRALRPEIPVELDAIVTKCLAKKADDRFANVAQLARALAPYGSLESKASAERIGRVLRTSFPDAVADTAPRDFTVPLVGAHSSSPALSSPSLPPDPRSISGSNATAVAWTGTDPSSGSSKRVRNLILASVALFLCGGAATFFLLSHKSAPPPPAITQADEPLVVTTPSATAMPSASTAPVEIAAPTTASAAPAETAPTTATPTPTATAKVAAGGGKKPASHPTPPAHPATTPHTAPTTTATQASQGDMWGERK